MAADEFEKRAGHSAEVRSRLAAALTEELQQRGRYEELVGEHTTVYVTGSCGRGEMSESSDVDPYLVCLTCDEISESRKSGLSTALDAALAACGLPDLDRSGEYAEVVTMKSLIDSLGAPEDDKDGALTKRMLLVLESAPLINREQYSTLLDKVLVAYWKNATRHRNDYLPIVLVNDIVRYWRIVVLNHESRIAGKDWTPEEESAERRLRSYKLRLARCLTCFSALLYLLFLTRDDPPNVMQSDVRRMVGMTPMKRLEHIAAQAPEVAGDIQKLREIYGRYLQRTGGGKAALLAKLQHDDDPETRGVSDDGNEFTKIIFQLVQQLGQGRRLHRCMVV